MILSIYVCTNNVPMILRLSSRAQTKIYNFYFVYLIRFSFALYISNKWLFSRSSRRSNFSCSIWFASREKSFIWYSILLLSWTWPVHRSTHPMLVSWHCLFAINLLMWTELNGLAGAWFVARFDRATGEVAPGL